MDGRVLHKHYKNRNIRSSPIEGRQVKGPLKWKVQLNITFPKGAGMETIREYLIEEPRYVTQGEAHIAGLSMVIVSSMNGSEQAASLDVSRRFDAAVTC